MIPKAEKIMQGYNEYICKHICVCVCVYACTYVYKAEHIVNIMYIKIERDTYSSGEREREKAITVSEIKTICAYFYLLLPGVFKVNSSKLSMTLTISKSQYPNPHWLPKYVHDI